MAADGGDALILGGIGVIRRGDRFLIRRRPPGTVYAGYWEFPGGKVEPGETPEQATVRECLEETGLAVVATRLRSVVEHAYPHGRVRLHFFDCTPADPVAEPAPEHACIWVPAKGLAGYRFPEANDAILAQLVAESGSP
ncbi:(deoxy)nucleoside triphosphate pyrophosphohydrolase [Paludisphaera mucosa]|uniref:8-oxo-dGTP diphosphatase n=1 Tax=Paludisphaera mucosa TaxID=3030827 RepID=A0ABT6F9Z9_9BACT|nr:(deoxy)nucleoside triphosphate pyrophosphohydrolase [Paludisphaera mucosa]MDG3004413.1 (deoxy)nucleoside triphosphate pyrophosphohydrolase [Paludisphaera mucosa]